MEKSYYSTFFAENNLFSGIFPFFAAKTAEKPEKNGMRRFFLLPEHADTAARRSVQDAADGITGSGFRGRFAEGRRMLVGLSLNLVKSLPKTISRIFVLLSK